MAKKLNLFSQRASKKQRKPYRSLPIRKVAKNPKQTSKERYYKDKRVRIFNEEVRLASEEKPTRKFNIRKAGS